jgi:hypothetical protein
MRKQQSSAAGVVHPEQSDGPKRRPQKGLWDVTLTKEVKTSSPRGVGRERWSSPRADSVHCHAAATQLRELARQPRASAHAPNLVPTDKIDSLLGDFTH